MLGIEASRDLEEETFNGASIYLSRTAIPCSVTHPLAAYAANTNRAIYRVSHQAQDRVDTRTASRLEHDRCPPQSLSVRYVVCAIVPKAR